MTDLVIKCSRCKTNRLKSQFLSKKGRLLKGCIECQKRNKRYADKRKEIRIQKRLEEKNKILNDVKSKIESHGLTKNSLLELFNTINKNNLWDGL